MRKILFSLTPPQEKSVNQEVAGFVAAGKKEKRFTSHRFQNAARYQLYLGTHIMVPCLDRFETTRAPASGVFADMHGRFCIDTESQSFRVRIYQSVYLPDVFEDRVGVLRFF